MQKAAQAKPNAPEKEEKAASTRDEGFEDTIPVYTAPSGVQYVRVIDIILSDKAFNEMERLSKVVGLRRGAEETEPRKAASSHEEPQP